MSSIGFIECVVHFVSASLVCLTMSYIWNTENLVLCLLKEFQINCLCREPSCLLRHLSFLSVWYCVYTHTSFFIVLSIWLYRIMLYLQVVFIWCSICIFLIFIQVVHHMILNLYVLLILNYWTCFYEPYQLSVLSLSLQLFICYVSEE